MKFAEFSVNTILFETLDSLVKREYEVVKFFEPNIITSANKKVPSDIGIGTFSIS
jgi:hypothetical protein